MSDNIAEHIAGDLPEVRTWEGRPAVEQLATLPNSPAVLLFLDGAGAPIQLLTSQQLRRFVVARLSLPFEARRGRADIAEVARGVRWRTVHCPFEARWWYYRLARRLHPREYRKLVAFGLAWFLHVDWSHPIAEIRVTEQVWCAAGEYIGPWPSHKVCQAAREGLVDLFDLCRYPEQVRRAPRGTKCAYGEMGRCDAPCDGSVSLDAYLGRSRAAWRFARGAAGEWIEDAAARMRRAAAEQKYELAAQVRGQVEFARLWQAQWATHVRPADELSCLLVLPVTRRRAWKPFLFRSGHLSDGPVVGERRMATEIPVWLDTELTRAPEDVVDAVRMEQTWLACQLLLGREREPALVVPLSNLASPQKLEEWLRAEAAALRARRGAHGDRVESAFSSDTDTETTIGN